MGHGHSSPISKLIRKIENIGITGFHDVENIEAFPVAEFAITFFCVKIGHTVDELFNFIYEFTHHNQV